MPSEPLRTRIQHWLRGRVPLAGLETLLAHKTVPLHGQAVWYYTGGLILTALAALLVTGPLLLIYYQPHVPADMQQPGAHESVQRIVNDVPHGWWIRSIHHWASQLMIAALFGHLLSVLLLKAYRAPRELTWWSGLVLAGLTLASGFAGYLLPWNDLSFAATRVGTGIVGAVPLAGPLVRQLLLGGPELTELTLPRFFGLHAVVLPILMLGTVGAHLVLVVYHGSSVPPAVQRDADAGAAPPAIRFWPEFFYRDLRAWMLALGGLLVVSFLWPPDVGLRADPLAPTPEGIKPEWYFLAFYKVLKLLPAQWLGLENLQLGVLGGALVGLVLVGLPVLEAAPGRTAGARRRSQYRRRILLVVGLGLGWAASIAPVREALLACWPTARGEPPSSTTIALVFAAAALILLLMMDRISRHRPDASCTLLGMVLVSAFVGYTIWEGLGARASLAGLLILWGAFLVFWAASGRRSNALARLARWTAAMLLVAALLTVVPLGQVPEHALASAAVSSSSPAADVHPVLSDRRWESSGQFAAAMLLWLFLLILIECRVRFHRTLRQSGLFR